MKKVVMICLSLLVLLLIAGCGTTTTNQIICNAPYIQVGSDCCLDKDNNHICDKDEQEIKNITPKIEEPLAVERKWNCSSGDEFVTSDPNYTFNETKDCPQLVEKVVHEMTCETNWINVNDCPSKECSHELPYKEMNKTNANYSIICCQKCKGEEEISQECGASTEIDPNGTIISITQTHKCPNVQGIPPCSRDSRYSSSSTNLDYTCCEKCQGEV